MAKITTSAKFKQYNQQQSLLLPPSLEELIEKTHLVRVVNDVVEGMDLSGLINRYKGGGTTAYQPRMLLKILLYAYCTKIYTGRRIARALCQDIHFMWLSAFSRPDFRTINNFRSGRAKEAIESLFKGLLLFLTDHQYIKMESYFCDGSSFAADGNRHKMVWKKNADRYKASAEEKCRTLFAEIDQLNAAEDQQYGSRDLEETGSSAEVPVSKETIAAQSEKLSRVMAAAVSPQIKRKAASLQKKLKEKQDQIARYEQQQHTAGKRNSYNRTDKDATAMRMKNGETLPAYNILAGSESQFIVSCSVHQNGNDAACFKEHAAQLEKHSEQLPDTISGDSIFGTEENYELLENKGIGNYLKFPSFHNERKRKCQNNPFLKENFSYDPSADTYTCPDNRQLRLRAAEKQTHKKSGYVSVIKSYSCDHCGSCRLREQCLKPGATVNRTIQVNEKLERYKQQARENLKTDKGIQLRKQRGIEIESCFGDIKHNMGFRRFHLRGLDKVKTEWCVVAMAHNLRKIHLRGLKKAA